MEDLMSTLLQTTKTRIKAREEHLRKLKRLYRDPDHQPPKLATDSELRFQKREATFDYAIVAASRGKVHRHRDDFDSQADFIQKDFGGGRAELPELMSLLAYGQHVHDARKAKRTPMTWRRWEELNDLTSGKHGSGLLEQIG
jgi:hypothetical protein